MFEPERGISSLESVAKVAKTRGRHSLIGIAPDLVFRAAGSRAEINHHWLTDREGVSLNRAVGSVTGVNGLMPDGCAENYLHWRYSRAISVMKPSGWSKAFTQAPQSKLRYYLICAVCSVTVILVIDRLDQRMFLVLFGRGCRRHSRCRTC
jgi:hypothetical protein